MAAYYVVSEAFTNAAKHARASQARASTRRRGGWLELSVTDDGRGGAGASGGSGLTGLVDRVEAIGGTMHIDSRPGLGTAIQVKLPIKSTPADAGRRLIAPLTPVATLRKWTCRAGAG